MRAWLLVALPLAVGCGSSSSSSSQDAGGSKDASPDVVSKCGQPGDKGNSLGVGQYCSSIGDCSTTTDSPICSVLGDPETHFCTKTCSAPTEAGTEAGAGTDAGNAASCGENATCQCNSQGCGCTPNACL